MTKGSTISKIVKASKASKDAITTFFKDISEFIVIIFRKISGLLLFCIIPVVIGFVLLYVSNEFKKGIEKIDASKIKLDNAVTELNKLIDDLKTKKDDFLEMKDGYMKQVEDLQAKLKETSTQIIELLDIIDNLPRNIIDTTEIRTTLDTITNTDIDISKIDELIEDISKQVDEGTGTLQQVLKELENVLNTVRQILAISSQSYYGFGIFFLCIGGLAGFLVIFSRYK